MEIIDKNRVSILFRQTLNRRLPVWQKPRTSSHKLLVSFQAKKIEKTMAKPVGLVKNKEEPVICNKVYIELFTINLIQVYF